MRNYKKERRHDIKGSFRNILNLQLNTESILSGISNELLYYTENEFEVR